MEIKDLILIILLAINITMAYDLITTWVHEQGHCKIYNKYGVECKRICLIGIDKEKGLVGWADANPYDLEKLSDEEKLNMSMENLEWDIKWYGKKVSK